MKWKNRLTNYNFWISIISAVLLILQAFNINFDVAYINEIATAVLGLLVVIGIINDPTKSANVETKTTDLEKVSSAEVEETNQVVEEHCEEKTAEETVIPFNVKNENDSNNSETDFKAIVETISQDLKNKLKEIVESTIMENKQHNVEEAKASYQEQIVEENKDATQPVESTCYNIVN